MYKSSFKDHLKSIKHKENSEKVQKAQNKKRLRIEQPKFYCNKFEMLTKSFFQKHLSAKHSENPKSSKGTKQKKFKR